MLIFRVILLAGIVFVTFLVINEVLGWRRSQPLVSGRQRLLRVCSGITLILLLGLTLAGNILGIVFTSDPHSLVQDRKLLPAALGYASLVMGLALLLVVLALLDIREVIKNYRASRGQLRAGAPPNNGGPNGKDGRL